MYKLTKNDGDVTYGVKEFVCDTAEDLTSLPNCDMGSTAIVLAPTAAVYMKNSNDEWVKM